MSNQIKEAAEPVQASVVDHPAHYNVIPGLECIDVVENFNFNTGNAIKYLWRAGLKSPDPIEDLAKAVWYCQRELDRQKGLLETGKE